MLGFGQATSAHEMFGQLPLAPASKLDILLKPGHVIVPAFG
jgi:hypothetical protein